MRALHVLAAAILIHTGATYQQPNDLSLDVMAIPPPQPKEEATAYSCGSGAGGGAGRASHGLGPPLKVTLVSVSPETFRRGDEIVFELLVEHVGESPIHIAMTRDPDVAPPCRPAEGDVTTGFALFTKGTNDLIAVGPQLFGSLAAAGATMTLSPGERLRVRVPANADVYLHSPLLDDTQTLEVEALFSTNTERGGTGDIERSRNALAVQVLRPR